MCAYGYTVSYPYLAYLNQQESKDTFVINIDSSCHKGAKTAIASYSIADMNLIDEAAAYLVEVIQKESSR